MLDESYSFYSSDSYELCVKGPDPAKLRKKPDQIPCLNLDDIPGYETSSEEEEELEQEPASHQTQITATEGMQSVYPETMAPDGRDSNVDMSANQRQSMNEKDYRQSLQYIEKFYQKQHVAAS